jgi:multidrug efflux pump
MNICEPFIRRPIATSLLAAALFLVGAVAYLFLPVARLPNVEFPTIHIRASQPGADPETMAATVAAPLERRLGEIAGITEMTSFSSLGTTSVTVQFDLGRSIDAAARDVQAAINAAMSDLPGDLPSPPAFWKSNPAASPVMILALTSDTMTPGALYDAADTVVAQRLSQVSGVAEVQISGAEQPAVRVRVRPDALANLGIGLDQVRTAITDATPMEPLGAIEGPTRAATIATNGQLTRPQDYEPIIVKSASGAVVRLGAIASIEEGVRNSFSAAWLDDRPAVLLIIQKEADANAIAVADRINALLPQLGRWIPAGIEIHTLSDRTGSIRASVLDLQLTLAASIGLVMLVVLLFLRRAVPTLAAGITVPLSLAGTVAVMWLAGFSLDNLSLMALTVSVGFVVDDAIVMIENVHRNLEAGLKPLEATLEGARQIGFTVVSITLSLVAAFIPILLMGGILGRLLREFSLTLAFAVLISAVISLSVTPMICAHWIKRSPRRRLTLLDRWIEPPLEAIAAGYARSLDVALRHWPAMLALTFTALALTVWLFRTAPTGFFPQGDNGMIATATAAPAGTSFAAMEALQRRVARIIQADPAVAALGSFVGSSGAYSGGNAGRIYITLKPLAERGVGVRQVIDRLRPQLARIVGVNVYMFPMRDLPVGGRYSNATYQFTLWSPDLEILEHWLPIVLDRFRKLPGLLDVSTDREQGGPELHLVVDRLAAARLGVSIEAIDTVLHDALAQRQVATIHGERNQYQVILEVDPRRQEGPASLAYLFVPGTDGNQVPLLSLVKLERSTAPLVVNHQGQFPSVTISYNLADGVSLGTSLERIRELMESLHPPDDLHAEPAGDARQLVSTQRSEPLLLLAAVIAVYIVLGVLYESLVHPITILSTLPSAGLGALLALRLTGNSLSIIALIGLVLLIGIVKKNGIMLVDFALAAEREQGLGPAEAIRAAAIERFRPITMTTLAALMGAIPLVVTAGPGAELRQPLGITIIGGLVVSQLLTIYTTPVIYLVLDRLRRRAGRPLAGRAPARLPSPGQAG